MSITPFDYSGKSKDQGVPDTGTSGIKLFDYSKVSSPAGTQTVAPTVMPTIAPVRTVTNPDNTLNKSVDVTPNYSKIEKVAMSGKLAGDSFVSGIAGLPEQTIRSIPSLYQTFTQLTNHINPGYLASKAVDKVMGTNNADKAANLNLAFANKLVDVVKNNTGFLDDWAKMGTDYQQAEDQKVPEDFRNSLSGQIASGVGGSIPFLASLVATRGLSGASKVAEVANMAKTGEFLGKMASISEKLGIPLNTLAESQQNKEQTVDELLKNGATQEQANKLGNQVFAVSTIATPILDKIGLFNPKIKNTLVKKLAQYGIDIGAEVAQENVQQSAQNYVTGKKLSEGAGTTSAVAGVTAGLFGLIAHGHLQLTGTQGQPTPTNETGAVDENAVPTVGDIIKNGQDKYTEDQKVTALQNANLNTNIVDPTHENAPDTPQYKAMKDDVTVALNEGASSGELAQHLVDNLHVSTDYAQNIVADAISSKNLKESSDKVNEDIKQSQENTKIQSKLELETKAKQDLVDRQFIKNTKKDKGISQREVNNVPLSKQETETELLDKYFLALKIEDKIDTLQKQLDSALAYKENIIGKESVKSFLVGQHGEEEYRILSRLSFSDKVSKDGLGELMGGRGGSNITKKQEWRMRHGIQNDTRSHATLNADVYAEQLGMLRQTEYTDSLDFLQHEVEVFQKKVTSLKQLPETIKFLQNKIQSLKKNGNSFTIPYKRSTDLPAKESGTILSDGTMFKKTDNLEKYSKNVDDAMTFDEKTHPEMKVLQDFKDRYKVDFDTYLVDKILTGKQDIFNNKKIVEAYGAANDSIAITKDAVENTAKHELIHLTLNNLDVIPEFKGFNKETILQEMASKMNKEYDPKRNAVEIEEDLAVGFENYTNGSYKPKGILERFFEFIKKTLDGFNNIVTATKGKVITDYYDAVLYGKSGRTGDVRIKNLGEISKYLVNNVVNITPDYKKVRVITLSNGLTSMKLKEDGGTQPTLQEMQKAVTEAYTESDILTTKILKDLEGKTIVSKQYILDATNRAEIKQIEKDIVRSVLETETEKVNVKDFADKVKLQLLPLDIKSSDVYKPSNSDKHEGDFMDSEGEFTPKYENISLPEDLKGDVENYRENIYESPIETSAGSVHFSYLTNNYFGHTRIEDMGDNQTRRVIEVQSDLYQKGNLGKEFASQSNRVDTVKGRIPEHLISGSQVVKEEFDKLNQLKKLEQYNDPTAHFRMIREEVRQATIDDKTHLQFPTGETAMKIEGLGETNKFQRLNEYGQDLRSDAELTTRNMSVGQQIVDSADDNWIITDVLEDGKFKAVPKSKTYLPSETTLPESKQTTLPDGRVYNSQNEFIEQFDISGKVDTNNPIYKFYEKEVGRYLKNNYDGKLVTDDKGVTWYEIPLKSEYKGAVTAFKEKVSSSVNEQEVKRLFPRYYEMVFAQNKSLGTAQGISRAYNNVKDRLSEEHQNDVNYTKIKIADETAKAFELLKQDPEYAKQIALGLELPPLDVTDTAISLAVSETARERGDTQLQADTEKARSLRQSRRGQEIVMERGRIDESSSAHFIQQVLERRKELVSEGRSFIKVLDQKAKQLKTKGLARLKSDIEIKAAQLDDFLDSITC